MFTNQTARQIVGGTAPLTGRGNAPVVAAVQGDIAANLTTFVRADLSFDISVIKAAARARYATKLDFINHYTGAPKLFWQRSIARRVIRETWSEARAQRHQIVWQSLPYNLPFTRAEHNRRAVLAAQMAGAPISGRGNAAYKAAASEYRAIGHVAQLRAYQAILRNVA